MGSEIWEILEASQIGFILDKLKFGGYKIIEKEIDEEEL